MRVTVDHAGHQEFTFEIDLSRARSRGFFNGGEIADGDDPIAADGHRVGERMIGFAGKDLGVVKDRR
jgi:hypothetical protein